MKVANMTVCKAQKKCATASRRRNLAQGLKQVAHGAIAKRDTFTADHAKGKKTQVDAQALPPGMVRPIARIEGQRLRLTRPLWSVDLETTGRGRYNDKVVQVAAVPLMPDGTRGQAHTWNLNPQMPVEKEAEEIHGLSDALLAHEMTFPQLAPTLYNLLKDGDLLGYNINCFDRPRLQYEFARAEIAFPTKDTAVIDAFRIFRSNVTRDSTGGSLKLQTAHQFYLGKKFDNAHDAEADAHACLSVLEQQVATHPDLPQTVGGLHSYSRRKCPDAKFDNYIKPPAQKVMSLRPRVRPALTFADLDVYARRRAARRRKAPRAHQAPQISTPALEASTAPQPRLAEVNACRRSARQQSATCAVEVR